MENENEINDGEKKWRPLSREQRRVAGVLVEKAKTTPDIYPMTVNAIVTASNQKSNRSPQMHLTADDVEEVLDELREMGMVVEIQGDGRKPKFKHLLYEWLGVDKVEIAVMAELLLRGQQSMGELRARASRMESIEGLSQLKPIVQDLIRRQLMISLTPEGRGQVVTHGLYKPEELAKLERQVTETQSASKEQKLDQPAYKNESTNPSAIEALQQQIAELTARVACLEQRLED